MSSQPSTGRARARRLETLWNRITLLIGCSAVVGIVAAVVVVISQQVVRTPVVDDEALARVGGINEEVTNRYTGQASESSLMDSTPRVKPTSSAAMSLASAVMQPPAAVPVMAGIENIDDKRGAISTALERYFSTATFEGRLTMVRDAERVKPLMTSYYAREPMPQPRWRGLGKAVRVDEAGYRFGYVQALFEDSAPTSLIIEETPDGRYLVDWECLVHYGELGWGEFLRAKPMEPKLLRVIATRSESTAPAATQCLELRHPAETGSVLGYFDKTDPKFATLIAQLDQGHWKDVPVTLRLCFPAAGATPPLGTGVRIASVEGKGWLILEQR